MLIAPSATLHVLNPATGEPVCEHPIASPDEVRAAVLRAKAAQLRWAALPVAHRVEVLRRFQSLLAERKREVAETITAEAGKPIVEALLTEVIVALDAARFCREHARGVMAEREVPHSNPAVMAKRARLVPEPIGVIGIISPWNYPFSIPATETLAALVTGNAVVLKPSELTPNSALKLRDLLHEAGVPGDVFQVVLGEGATGAALLAAPVDKIIFTGSVATGKRVAMACAERLIPCVLELGGKDAMIVLDDADVDLASSAAVWGGLVNAGQTCISVERCYVHRSLQDEFLAACARKIAGLRVGSGAESDTDIGPLISPRQLEIVEAQVEDARASGANVVCGGRRLPELGRQFYAPTLLTDVTHSMRVMREETFGPVLPVMSFDTGEQAIALANDSEFGLAASVWGRDRQRAEHVARRIEAGAVMVNDLISQFAISEAPHGGVKSSGIGRTHGLLGMQEMVRPKYIDIDLLPRMKKLWWYGYGDRFTAQMEGFTDMLFGSTLRTRLSGAVRSAAALWRKRM